MAYPRRTFFTDENSGRFPWAPMGAELTCVGNPDLYCNIRRFGGGWQILCALFTVSRTVQSLSYRSHGRAEHRWLKLDRVAFGSRSEIRWNLPIADSR